MCFDVRNELLEEHGGDGAEGASKLTPMMPSSPFCALLKSLVCVISRKAGGKAPDGCSLWVHWWRTVPCYRSLTAVRSMYGCRLGPRDMWDFR